MRSSNWDLEEPQKIIMQDKVKVKEKKKEVFIFLAVTGAFAGKIFLKLLCSETVGLRCACQHRHFHKQEEPTDFWYLV